MVTFKPVGRLGNFLFETASCLAYAWEHDVLFHIPNTTNDAYWNPIYLQHLSRPEFNPDLPTVTIREDGFPYQKRQFKPAWRNSHNIVLEGYWQTEKYFKHFRDRVIAAFGYPWRSVPKTVSVHVRRGDYLTIKRGSMFKHPPVTADWYRKQMKKFPDHVFCFFSDDLDWCHKEFDKYGACLFAPPFGELDGVATPIERDLVSMSCCEHHICSASTFSWWGAWLDQNPTKRVIMPQHWITPGWSNLDCSDVVPKDWERA